MLHLETTLVDWLARGVELVRNGLRTVHITDQRPTRVDDITWHWKRLHQNKIVPSDFFVVAKSCSFANRQTAQDVFDAACICWAQQRIRAEAELPTLKHEDDYESL